MDEVLTAGSILTYMLSIYLSIFLYIYGFPGGSAVKNPPANSGDPVSIPGSGNSLGEGNDNPL